MSQENMSQTQNQEQQDQLREIVEKITRKVEEFGKAVSSLPSIDKEEVDKLIRKWKNVRECLTHYCRLELSVFSVTLYAYLDAPTKIEIETGISSTVNDIVKMIQSKVREKFDAMLTETIDTIVPLLKTLANEYEKMKQLIELKEAIIREVDELKAMIEEDEEEDEE